MTSLQRSGAGLWFSPCGRFAFRRLLSGRWAISPVGAPDRIGGFTDQVSSQLIEQRFGSLRQARSVLELVLQLNEEKIEPVAVAWQVTGTGSRSVCSAKIENDQQESEIELRVDVIKTSGLWQIHALPEQLAQERDEIELSKSALPSGLIFDRMRYFLGQARTLREAQAMVSQELSCPWPAMLL